MQNQLDAAGVKSAAPAAAVSHAEWEAKHAAVKALLPTYKACQAEEAALQAEVDTLAETLVAVREQRSAVEARLTAAERAHGRVGHAAASMRLAKVPQCSLCSVLRCRGHHSRDCMHAAVEGPASDGWHTGAGAALVQHGHPARCHRALTHLQLSRWR